VLTVYYPEGLYVCYRQRGILAPHRVITTLPSSTVFASSSYPPSIVELKSYIYDFS